MLVCRFFYCFFDIEIVRFSIFLIMKNIHIKFVSSFSMKGFV